MTSIAIEDDSGEALTYYFDRLAIVYAPTPHLSPTIFSTLNYE